MASVSQLGYVGIGTGDEKAWHELATNILGMQVIPGDDRSTSYLRMDECHHRLELRSNGSDDLEFVGWEVPDPATLQRVAQQLEDGGVKVTPVTTPTTAASSTSSRASTPTASPPRSSAAARSTSSPSTRPAP